MTNSYSQFGEDKWISENLTLPAKGVYVDIGAAHPVETSNTAFLRDRGWNGLAIDAEPSWTECWTNIENFVCAIVSPRPLVRFNSNKEEPWISRIDGEGEQRTESIEAILDRFEIGKIDFLSIDIEGHEFEVLQSLDFDKHAPSIIVSEYDTRNIGEDFRVRDFLLGLGYSEVHRTLANIIYAK